MFKNIFKSKEGKNKISEILHLLFGVSTLALTIPAHAIVFNMAPLEFSNRAACADFSTKPTRSAFLQIDSFNAGKAGFSQGLISQRQNSFQDPKLIAQGAVKDFRIWTTHLAVQIADNLLKGKLPLLPQDGSYPVLFNKAVNKCLNKNELLSCPAMNDFLSELWARSKMNQPNWQELGFESKDFFPTDLSVNAAIGCHIIRKFSAFHSALQTQTVSNGTINNIGMESFKPEEHLDSCFSVSEGTDPRFTTVQIDIARLNKDKKWDKYGFQFWHSLKLFLSWAWRNAPEYRQEFGQFNQIFPSIAFEDSVMLIPNGCRSIEMPSCDSAGLASDTMRAAKFLGMTHPAIEEVPQKPIDTLFLGEANPVNNDVLGIFKSEDASAWARDFKEKLSGLRFEMMKKLNTGIGKLQVITSLIDAKNLTQDINSILDDPNYDKIETYLACTEYTLAKNDLFDDINQEIQTLNKTEEFKSVILSSSGKDLEAYIKYFNALTETMGPFCKTLEAQGRTRITTPLPHLYKSLHQWAYNILRPTERSTYLPQCTLTPEIPECPQNLDKKYLVSTPRQNIGVAEEFTICKTSLECARTVLESLVSIVSVRRYAHAFLPLEDVVSTPDLFNTYAAPTACKLYDPWSKQRNAWKLFVADLGSALINGASCGMLHAQALALPTKKVAGYKEIFDENQTTYDPIMQKDPLKYTAGIDYAFLPGFSCGVAVINTLLANQNKYYIPEFRVQACSGDDQTKYTLNKHVFLDKALNKIVQKTDETVAKGCFSCSINLQSVAKLTCATPVVGAAVATGIGVFQGVMRLVSNLSDGDNIVHTKELNVDQISQSFSDAKTITPKCHRELKRGVTCH